MKTKLLQILLFISVLVQAQEKPLSFAGNDLMFQDKALLKIERPDLRTVLQEDFINESNPGSPYRFGIPINVNKTTETSGSWSEFDRDFNMWQLIITAPDANAFTLQFDKFWLPAEGKLFIYSKDRSQVLGAYTNQHNSGDREKISGFATGFVPGDTIVLEYYEPKTVEQRGIISISKVIYVYKTLSQIAGRASTGEELFGCHVDINSSLGTNYGNIKNGIVLILANNYLGTGALVNTTDSDGKISYILTANHLLSGNQDAEMNNDLSNWVFYFGFESPKKNFYDALSSTRATIVANNSYTDFALIKMTRHVNTVGNNNYAPYFFGWNRSTNVSNNTICIHHPVGSSKKIAFSSVKPVIYSKVQNWQNSPASQPNTHWAVQFSQGTVQGGSSGAPLLDKDYRIIGTLHGGENSCSPVNKLFGRFDLSWDGSSPQRRLKDWLDPRNTNKTSLSGAGLVTANAKLICTGRVGNRETYGILDMPESAFISEWNLSNNNFRIVKSSGKEVTVEPLRYNCTTVLTATIRYMNCLYDTQISLATPDCQITGTGRINPCSYVKYQLSLFPAGATVQWSFSPGISAKGTTTSKIVNLMLTNESQNNLWVQAVVNDAGKQYVKRMNLSKSIPLENIQMLGMGSWRELAENGKTYEKKYGFQIMCYPSTIALDDLTFTWRSIDSKGSDNPLMYKNGSAKIETGGNIFGEMITIEPGEWETMEHSKDSMISHPFTFSERIYDPFNPNPVVIVPKNRREFALVTMPVPEYDGSISCTVVDGCGNSKTVSCSVENHTAVICSVPENPVNNSLNIQIQMENNESVPQNRTMPVIVNLYNEMKLVRSMRTDTSNRQIQIKTNDLPEGNYYLNVIVDNKQIENQVIIIKH